MIYVLFVLIGLVGIASVVFGATRDTYRYWPYVPVIAGSVAATVSLFGILLNVDQDSEARACEKLAWVAEVETKFDRWDGCFIKFEGRWYTESTWEELKLQRDEIK